MIVSQSQINRFICYTLWNVKSFKPPRISREKNQENPGNCLCEMVEWKFITQTWIIIWSYPVLQLRDLVYSLSSLHSWQVVESFKDGPLEWDRPTTDLLKKVKAEVIENKNVEVLILGDWKDNTCDFLSLLVLEIWNKENICDLGTKYPDR